MYEDKIELGNNLNSLPKPSKLWSAKYFLLLSKLILLDWENNNNSILNANPRSPVIMDDKTST